MTFKQPIRIVLLALVLLCSFFSASSAIAADSLQLGSRPLELAKGLPDGSLRSMLTSCESKPVTRTGFSVSHRGAPLKFPEHTREGYVAAANMGAGVIECDVTFTRDKSLVCRHSQCDLHTTTNILETPLAEKCSVTPNLKSGTPYKDVKCCTSDLTVDEFKTLRGKVDSGNKRAKTLKEYLSLKNTPRAELQGITGTLMTHRESIELFKTLNVKMIPELKEALVAMPFEGDFTQEQYAQALVDEYVSENVSPTDVFLQSFNLEDLRYWLKHTPQFGKQATWLDGRYRDRNFDVGKAKSWKPSMIELAESGIKILAPPMWMLLTLEEDQIVPSEYAKAATAADLDIIAWTLERSGSLKQGGGWYYQSIEKTINADSDVYAALHVLAQDVKVRGVFSDWPATTTYYANCAGLD